MLRMFFIFFFVKFNVLWCFIRINTVIDKRRWLYFGLVFINGVWFLKWWWSITRLFNLIKNIYKVTYIKLSVNCISTQTPHSQSWRKLSWCVYWRDSNPKWPTCGSAVGAGPIAGFLHQSFHTLPVGDLIRAYHDGSFCSDSPARRPKSPPNSCAQSWSELWESLLYFRVSEA